MYRSALIVVLIILAFNTALAQQSAVTVYMKDGKVLTGEILKRSNLIVQLRDMNGNVHVLFPDDIEKINEGVSAPAMMSAPVTERPKQPPVINQESSNVIQHDPLANSPLHYLKDDLMRLDNELLTRDLSQVETEVLFNKHLSYYYAIAGIPANYKSPVIAFLLSAGSPGLGQYYNEEIKKGVLFESSWFVGWVLVGVGASQDDDASSHDVLIISGASMALVSTIWSMIDAPKSAARINERINRAKWGFDFRKVNYLDSQQAESGPKSSNYNISVAFKF